MSDVNLGEIFNHYFYKHFFCSSSSFCYYYCAYVTPFVVAPLFGVYSILGWSIFSVFFSFQFWRFLFRYSQTQRLFSHIWSTNKPIKAFFISVTFYFGSVLEFPSVCFPICTCTLSTLSMRIVGILIVVLKFCLIIPTFLPYWNLVLILVLFLSRLFFTHQYVLQLFLIAGHDVLVKGTLVNRYLVTWWWKRGGEAFCSLMSRSQSF